MTLEEIEALTLEQIEQWRIEVALRRHGGNVTRAAESLGISRRTLQRKTKAERLLARHHVRARLAAGAV